MFLLVLPLSMSKVAAKEAILVSEQELRKLATVLLCKYMYI